MIKILNDGLIGETHFGECLAGLVFLTFCLRFCAVCYEPPLRSLQRWFFCTKGAIHISEKIKETDVS